MMFYDFVLQKQLGNVSQVIHESLMSLHLRRGQVSMHNAAHIMNKELRMMNNNYEYAKKKKKKQVQVLWGQQFCTIVMKCAN